MIRLPNQMDTLLRIDFNQFYKTFRTNFTNFFRIKRGPCIQCINEGGCINNLFMCSCKKNTTLKIFYSVLRKLCSHLQQNCNFLCIYTLPIPSPEHHFPLSSLCLKTNPWWEWLFLHRGWKLDDSIVFPVFVLVLNDHLHVFLEDSSSYSNRVIFLALLVSELAKQNLQVKNVCVSMCWWLLCIQRSLNLKRFQFTSRTLTESIYGSKNLFGRISYYQIYSKIKVFSWCRNRCSVRTK